MLLTGAYVAAGLYGLASGTPLRRDAINLLLMATYLQLALMCFWAARREPGAGFSWVGVCLLAVVPLGIGLALAHVHGVVLRYWAVLPIVAMQPMLLIVILMRRRIGLEAEVARRAAAEQTLTELNASLEQQVAQRTGDLVDIIQGLESFNRSVSHDLRGPLGGIAGAATLAEQALARRDTAAVQRMLSAIGMQAMRSTELVDALLQLARVRDAPLHPQPVELGRITRDVIEQLRLTVRDAPFPPIDITHSTTVQADPELLRAILTNLIGNAVKFTRGHAEPSIEVAARPLPGQIEVSVRDNGAGFEPTASRAAVPALPSPARQRFRRQWRGLERRAARGAAPRRPRVGRIGGARPRRVLSLHVACGAVAVRRAFKARRRAPAAGSPSRRRRSSAAAGCAAPAL